MLRSRLRHRLVLDHQAKLSQARPHLLPDLPSVLQPLLRRRLAEPVFYRPRHFDLLLLSREIRLPTRQPELGRPDIGRQRLLMRHDDRATFERALEDLGRRH